MTGNKYIELDSSYRNRNIYPLSSQFVVPINQSTYRTKQSAIDPVCDSAPIKVFTEIFDFSNTGLNYIYGGLIFPVYATASTNFKNLASQSEIIFKVTLAFNSCSSVDDYYVGSMIVTKTTNERRRIIQSRLLYTTEAYSYLQLSLESSFPSTITHAAEAQIINPSYGVDTVGPPAESGARSFLFIPAGTGFTNFYKNYYITNQTRNETRKIISYNSTTRLAQVDEPFSAFAYSDVFAIRTALPYEIGTLASNGTTTTAFLPTATSSAVNDYYRGDYIRFYSLSTVRNDMRRIVSYVAYTEDPVTKVKTFVNKVTFEPPLDANTTAGTPYEILQFTRDNAVPFNYTGNELGSQEMVCYDIMLINVIIPNKSLSIAGSKRLPFYTHVYVEFTNETAPGSGQTGLIYSNNPNSNRMLFRATIDDIASPLNTAFLKFNGDNMVQTIKFKPNDNLRFSVRLHTGEYLQFTDAETYSPLAPNPDIQISAIFSINRVIDS